MNHVSQQTGTAESAPLPVIMKNGEFSQVSYHIK